VLDDRVRLSRARSSLIVRHDRPMCGLPGWSSLMTRRQRDGARVRERVFSRATALPRAMFVTHPAAELPSE
jgi:hypothetical protein